jgi:hypothetical protein
MAVVSKIERVTGKPVENIFFAGNLVEYQDVGKPYVVFLYDGSEHKDYFEGVVVYSENSDWSVGDVDEGFVKNMFKQFEGTITLTGSK